MLAIQSASREYKVEIAIEMAFILCSRGAEWDDEHHRQALRLCEMYDEKEGASTAERQTRRQWREGLCVCVHHWALEQHQTTVPSEVVARGAASVTTYLADITRTGAAGFGLTYRCKSCVVGPSEWGKTSLVRSLVARKPSLTQLKDRTIGIDLVACIFGEDDDAAEGSVAIRQEVTFWDFAGQSVYHVAHSPFFSRRTLYLVAVDLEAYSTQLARTQAMPSKYGESAMNRFVTLHIWRWLSMIIAHHPVAQFVFIGTKADRVENEETIQDIREDVQDRFKRWGRNRDHHHDRSGGQLSAHELARATTRSFSWLVMNPQDPESIAAARQTHQQRITSLEIGFPMGTTYSQVLRSVKARREDARSAETGLARIERSIVLSTTLRRELAQEIGLERCDCEQILRTLTDLGDILWYEHADAGVLENFIILDPMLVLDAVREVVRHDFAKQSGVEWPQDGRITHAVLSTFPLWKDIDKDKEMMHAFKKLLQHFQLAYPADDDVMRPESELIVPTHWKVKVDRSPSSRWLLVTQKSVCDDFVKHRWCWEYELPNELVEIVFDQLAVQSHAAQLKRRIQDSRIEAKCDEFATSIRLMQQNTSTDIIRIEVSGTTVDRSWHTMRFYLLKMEKALDDYKGIDVGRYIVHRASSTSKSEARYPVGPVARAVKSAIVLGESERSVRAKMPWMPPDMLWYVTESWKKDILQFQQLQMTSTIEAKLEVLRKLAIAGAAPRLPALWSLQCVPEEKKAVLRVLSDLSGQCYHTPIEIDTGSPVLVKYGRYFKVSQVFLGRTMRFR
jgi:GTPase SAR1 family protein